MNRGGPTSLSPIRKEKQKMIKRFILRLFFKLIGKNPAKMEMVRYWKHGESVQAKVMKSKDGNLIMKMEGEKYDFPSFPRGHLLFGQLSKLKHEIKNQIFNESWRKLEEGIKSEEIIRDIKGKLFGEIAEIAELSKYDMLPPKSMCVSVKEIYRAWTKISPETGKLRDYLCLILQEDDGYRMRLQWLVNYFNPNGLILRWLNIVGLFEKALIAVEHAEVIGDMKERIRLLRRILLLSLKDEKIRELFEKLCKEIDWNKIKLTKADKYFFRGKYFKVDADILEY